MSAELLADILGSLSLPAEQQRFDFDWDAVIRTARRAGLLPRLALVLRENGRLDAVPPRPGAHLEAALVLSEKHAADVRREIDNLVAALSGIVDRIVLLKGAAYLAAGLPPSRGRIFGDIDICVPRASLSVVEAMLGVFGWQPGSIHPYDDAYYRRWMHQIPPLVHRTRGSAVDVHHTIVPLTARPKVPADLLLQAARPVDANSKIAVLAPCDMVLHSATHLFNEGEFVWAFRDLHDLDLLLRHFAAEQGFWSELIERAEILDLRRPLFYLLRYTARVFRTPVPEDALRRVEAFGPPAPLRPLMDTLLERALAPNLPLARDRWSPLALALLYGRGHYLRMPVHLLVPHLIRKAVRRPDDG